MHHGPGTLRDMTRTISDDPVFEWARLRLRKVMGGRRYGSAADVA